MSIESNIMNDRSMGIKLNQGRNEFSRAFCGSRMRQTFRWHPSFAESWTASVTVRLVLSNDRRSSIQFVCRIASAVAVCFAVTEQVQRMPVYSQEKSRMEVQNLVRFQAQAYENGRFVAVLACGNGRGRKAHLTVFDVLGEERKLRKLHQQELLNDCTPVHWYLCGAGRFFITIDDWAEPMPYALVVYDLVRKEHTAYRMDEILTEDEIKKLPNRSFHEWFDTQKRHFNPEKLEMYITPESDYIDTLSPSHTKPIAEGIPFLVVDLQTRKVQVAPTPSQPNKETALGRLSQSLNVSSDGDTGRPPLLLPKMLIYLTGTDGVVTKQFRYRLNTNTLEYENARDDEWVEKQFDVPDCYDWTRVWRPGYWPWGQYPWVPPAWPRTWPGEDLWKWPEFSGNWWNELENLSAPNADNAKK